MFSLVESFHQISKNVSYSINNILIGHLLYQKPMILNLRYNWPIRIRNAKIHILRSAKDRPPVKTRDQHQIATKKSSGLVSGEVTQIATHTWIPKNKRWQIAQFVVVGARGVAICFRTPRAWNSCNFSAAPPVFCIFLILDTHNPRSLALPMHGDVRPAIARYRWVGKIGEISSSY